MLALPEPLPESQTSAASDQVAHEIINQAGNPAPSHSDSKALQNDDGKGARCHNLQDDLADPDENPWLELDQD